MIGFIIGFLSGILLMSLFIVSKIDEEEIENEDKW